MATTQDLLRTRFAEASAERDVILEKAKPLREKRDAIHVKAAADLAAKTEPLDTQIAALESGLPTIMAELATLVSALDGKTAQ